MRWFVEVSRVGESGPGDRFCVEAKQWQAALQDARKLRGDSGPLSKFSIELLDEGYRAVDPKTKIRYVVRAAPADAVLTDASELVAPSAEAVNAGGAASVNRGAESRSGSVAPPRPATSSRASSPPRSGSVAARKSQPSRGGAAVASIPKAPAVPQDLSAPLSVVGAPSPSSTQPIPSLELPPTEVIRHRSEDPSDTSPITYREIAYATTPGASRAAVEALLWRHFRELAAALSSVSGQKFIQLAIFDHRFERKPERPPLGTLAWKDWRGGAVTTFPYFDGPSAKADSSIPPPSGWIPSAPPPPLAPASAAPESRAAVVSMPAPRGSSAAPVAPTSAPTQPSAVAPPIPADNEPVFPLKTAPEAVFPLRQPVSGAPAAAPLSQPPPPTHDDGWDLSDPVASPAAPAAAAASPSSLASPAAESTEAGASTATAVSVPPSNTAPSPTAASRTGPAVTVHPSIPISAPPAAEPQSPAPEAAAPAVPSRFAALSRPLGSASPLPPSVEASFSSSESNAVAAPPPEHAGASAPVAPIPVIAIAAESTVTPPSAPPPPIPAPAPMAPPVAVHPPAPPPPIPAPAPIAAPVVVQPLVAPPVAPPPPIAAPVVEPPVAPPPPIAAPVVVAPLVAPPPPIAAPVVVEPPLPPPPPIAAPVVVEPPLAPPPPIAAPLIDAAAVAVEPPFAPLTEIEAPPVVVAPAVEAPAVVAPPAAAPSRDRASRPRLPVSSRRLGEDLIGELFETMHDLNFMPDVPSGAEFVLEAIESVIPCEAILVHVFDIDSSQFVVVRARGRHPERALLQRMSDASPLATFVMRRPGCVLLDGADDARIASGNDRWQAIGVAPRRLLVAPVRQGGRYLGLLEIANPSGDEPFQPSEQNAVDYVSEQFAAFLAARPIVVDDDVVLRK